MSFERQLLDCNCNDCLFMVRDIPRFQQSLQFHHDLQLQEFERRKTKLLEAARYYHREKGDLEKYQSLSDQAAKMKFQFDKSAAKINFGTCSKLDKAVQFIPNYIQLETQGCFVHRKATNLE